MIITSWPNRALHPNSRVDRRAATPIRAAAKTAGFALAREYVQKGGFLSDHLALTFCPPDLRKRDLDGAFSAMKAFLDGVSQGIGRDDSHWSFTLRWGPNDKDGGRVAIMFAADAATVPLRGEIS